MEGNYAETLRVAEGWMELGVMEEAWDHFVSIPAKERTNPESVILWVRMLSAEEDFGEATRIGRLGLRTYPDCGILYFLTAYNAARCEGPSSAKAILFSGARMLKHDPMWQLGVAYYDCQLGDSDLCEGRLDYVFAMHPDFCRGKLNNIEEMF